MAASQNKKRFKIQQDLLLREEVLLRNSYSVANKALGWSNITKTLNEVPVNICKKDVFSLFGFDYCTNHFGICGFLPATARLKNFLEGEGRKRLAGQQLAILRNAAFMTTVHCPLMAG